MFDIHVHSAPCLFPRALADRAVGSVYEAAGYDGIVLKGHFESTVGRAHTLQEIVTISVYGGVVLNRAAGGMNPAAVAASLVTGGRVVWMPTVDAKAHRRARLPIPAGYSRYNGAAAGEACPPEDWSSERQVRAILTQIADADAVLGTGHLSTPEIAWLIPAARKAGVRRIVINHPTFTAPNMEIAELRACVELGAYAEITAYQFFHQHGTKAEPLAQVVRAIGHERCIISSDSGQPESPPGPDGIAAVIDSLARAGLDRKALEAAAAETPYSLLCSDTSEWNRREKRLPTRAGG
jgi:hypothetical protein